MKKELENLKNLFQERLNFWTTILFDAVFSIAFLYIAFSFTIWNIQDANQADQYKVLFSAIGITIALASLSFRACSSTTDEAQKHTFYTAGERLFHAVILFIGATILKYGYFILIKKNYDDLLQRIVSNATIVTSMIAFYFGIIYSMISLQALHVILKKSANKKGIAHGNR